MALVTGSLVTDVSNGAVTESVITDVPNGAVTWSWITDVSNGAASGCLGKLTFRMALCHGVSDNRRFEWRCVMGSVITDVSNGAVTWSWITDVSNGAASGCLGKLTFRMAL